MTGVSGAARVAGNFPCAVPEAANAVSAPGQAEQIIFRGRVQYSMYYLPLHLIAQRKEKRQSESNEKPEVLRGRYWCSHHPRVCSPATEPLGARRFAGHHEGRCTGCLGAGWLTLLRVQDRRQAEGWAPACHCSTTESPQVPPGKAFPACFLYPEFIRHLSFITYL